MLYNLLLILNRKITKDKDVKEIAKGGSIAFIMNIIGMGIGYVFVILVSAIYKNSSAAIYGQYVLVSLLLRTGSMFTRFGTDTSMLKYTAGFASNKLWGNIVDTYKKSLVLLILFNTIIILIIMLLSAQVAELFNLPQGMVQLSSIFILPMALTLFHSQSIRGLKKIGISSFLQNSAFTTFNTALLLLIFPIANKNASYFKNLPSYTLFAAIVIGAIVSTIQWIRSMPSKTDQRNFFDATQNLSLKQIFNGSYPLLLVESGSFVSLWIEQIMLGILATHEDVGIYSVCLKYAILTSLSLRSVNTISAPKFAEYFFQNDYKNLGEVVRKSTKMIFWVAFPVACLYTIFPNFFLGIFGNSFTHGSIALSLLGVGALINVMTGSVGTLLQMTGHQKIVHRILWLSVFLEIILNWALIPLFGVTGAAMASIVCSAVKNFSMVFYVKKHFGFYTVYFPVFFEKMK
jgi:O-antigen/teichoic acid export membrane protein